MSFKSERATPLPDLKEPCFFHTLETIPERNLRAHFYEPVEPTISIVALAYLYALLLKTSSLERTLSIATKAYVDMPHGQEQRAYHGTICPDDLLEDFGHFRTQAERMLGSCIFSVSGIFTPSDQSKKWAIPAMDLEISSTGSDIEALERDLGGIADKLIEGNFSGFFIRSGDVGKGSYHFMGDFALPYNPYYWTELGRLMVILTDDNNVEEEGKQNISNSLVFGRALLEADSLEEAREISPLMLREFPSIPAGETRSGLYYDPRWVGHRLVGGANYLRQTRAKGYSHPPKLVGEIY